MGKFFYTKPYRPTQQAIAGQDASNRRRFKRSSARIRLGCERIPKVSLKREFRDRQARISQVSNSE